ncbi:hypothetical protein EDD15DRAFT_1471968 [Pisolithus albus]|nr:hypothetical protein EDD15DRAFT_1471968 [Pisolithus albus]
MLPPCIPYHVLCSVMVGVLTEGLPALAEEGKNGRARASHVTVGKRPMTAFLEADHLDNPHTDRILVSAVIAVVRFLITRPVRRSRTSTGSSTGRVQCWLWSSQWLTKISHLTVFPLKVSGYLRCPTARCITRGR